MYIRVGLKKRALAYTDLVVNTEVEVRFSEVDAMGVVWHGNYIKYFEDGREAFGEKYGIKYLDVFANGFMTPIVKTVCEHKLPLAYGDVAVVQTQYINTEAAKIHFLFTIYRKSDNQIAATGESVQVFIDEKRQLVLTNPEFYVNWKKKVGLL